MARLTGMRLVGGNLMVGTKHRRGWSELRFSDGTNIKVWDDSLSMNELCDHAERFGHDATSFRKRLDQWTKEGGIFPPDQPEATDGQA